MTLLWSPCHLSSANAFWLPLLCSTGCCWPPAHLVSRNSFWSLLFRTPRSRSLCAPQHASKIIFFLISEVLWNLWSPLGLEGLNPPVERLFPFQMICWLKRFVRMALEQVGLNMESVSVGNMLCVCRSSSCGKLLGCCILCLPSAAEWV